MLTPSERIEARRRGLAPLPDPPVREDGSCFVCGQPRAARDVKPLYAKAAAADPFCSTACARAWHGHPLAPTGREANGG